ncbi:hypothetical protein B9479_000592 [Cryptococcus floricola]|uniref:Uncharacterized protein n=1 Tax=Cryptococcus floricola TaxID=2591691 RepID=A0A5D3B8R8_9TREE|nr:hypothetical protein B9479_000592 [Cryptococcus floricola]
MVGDSRARRASNGYPTARASDTSAGNSDRSVRSNPTSAFRSSPSNALAASAEDPPRPSYPSHPEAKYDGAPPRDAQRSSYNSNQAKYDAASPSVSGRGRTQNLPTRSQRPSKTNSRPPSRGSHESDESRHDYYQPSARPRRGDPNIISVEVDEEHEEYDDRRSRLPRARHDEGTERVTMRTHTRTSGGQQQPSRSNDSREAVVGDDDPDPYYVTRSSGRSNLPGRSPRDSRKPSSRKSQWDKY